MISIHDRIRQAIERRIFPARLSDEYPIQTPILDPVYPVQHQDQSGRRS